MATLNGTQPHYVRCIKPNDAKAAFVLDNLRVLGQLRACGVLETVRVAAAGYPSRWVYAEFAHRYRPLAVALKLREAASTAAVGGSSSLTTAAAVARTLCEALVPRVLSDPDQYRFGVTKVFFRTGQVRV